MKLDIGNKHTPLWASEHFLTNCSHMFQVPLGTSLQVLPSLWSADFLQKWRQEIPQIIAQNS